MMNAFNMWQWLHKIMEKLNHIQKEFEILNRFYINKSVKK